MIQWRADRKAWGGDRRAEPAIQESKLGRHERSGARYRHANHKAANSKYE